MYSAAADMDALIYGETHPNVVNYLRNQFTNVSEKVVGAARDFFQKGYEIFERSHGHQAIEYARSVLQNALSKTQMRADVIRPLLDVHSLQDANLQMQRWIMAHQGVRNLYTKQQCDGYMGTYTDVQPGAVGQDHYDYRRVTDKVMMFDDDGEWYVNEYFEDLKEGDRELLDSEKFDILKTWTALDFALALNEDDPTSKIGGKL